VLLRNEGTDANGVPRFTDVAMATGADDVKDGRGLAVADFDNDGALDVVINNNPGDNGCKDVAPTLLRNNVGARRNWLAVELEGVQANRDAVGAEVLIENDPARCTGQPWLAKQLRHVTAGGSYASQHSFRLYFGLGELDRVDKLTVRWPGGGEEVFTNLAAKQLVRITQGRGMRSGPLPAPRSKSVAAQK
jgi:enediyne biosynthesis protein E4